jgi:hypothetical protein
MNQILPPKWAGSKSSPTTSVEHHTSAFLPFSSKLKDLTGERWTTQLITFFWTQSHTLRKDRCASAHAPTTDNIDASSARARQTTQYSVKMAYAHGPLMLDLDRRWKNALNHERVTWSLGPRQCFQEFVTASVMLGNNFLPVTNIPVIISLTWQRQNEP